VSTYVPPIANLTVSSIPGAPSPLYLGGAKVLHLHKRAFAQPGAGLLIAYVGYGDTVDISTASRDLVPDPERIAAGLRDHLALLLAPARDAELGLEPRAGELHAAVATLVSRRNQR
jgi:diacylglycerol O-acyltransferase